MEFSKEWVESTEHPGYMMLIVKHGNCTVELYRPILDPAERAKREAHFRAVCESVLANHYRRKMEEKEREQQNHN